MAARKFPFRVLRVTKTAFALAIALSLPAVALAEDWKIDGKTSKVKFIAKTRTHVRAVGTFSNVTGVLKYDPEKPENSSVSARIPLATMTTGVNVRDEDLKGPKYFDASKYPVAYFTAKNLNEKGSKFILTGQLKLHGVSKPVVISMDKPEIKTDRGGQRRLSATGRAIVDQKDFGLTLSKLHPDGAVWVNREIALTIEVRAAKFKNVHDK